MGRHSEIVSVVRRETVEDTPANEFSEKTVRWHLLTTGHLSTQPVFGPKSLLSLTAAMASVKERSGSVIGQARTEAYMLKIQGTTPNNAVLFTFTS